MSDYRPSSQLSAINAAAGASVPADSSMIEILESASEVSRLTEGAFDATVGPAVLLWRESRRSGAPSSAAVMRAKRPLERTPTSSTNEPRLLAGIASRLTAVRRRGGHFEGTDLLTLWAEGV